MKRPLLNWDTRAGVPICELDRDIWAMRGVTRVMEHPGDEDNRDRDFTFTQCGERLVLTVKYGDQVTVYDCIVDRTFDFSMTEG